MAKRKYKRLHYEDRQTIEAMSKQGSSVSDIAEVLGTHRDTIYREFKRCNATLKTYTAAAGQQAIFKWGYKEVLDFFIENGFTNYQYYPQEILEQMAKESKENE